MKKHIREIGLKQGDEAWLVVDRDQWSEADLHQLYEWSQENTNYGFALSNPLFEYWLLLHFEDGHGIKTAQDCITRLKNHLPSYDKGIVARKFALSCIESAVHRAEQRDNPPCKDWPRQIGSTTVYRLVKKLLTEEN